MPLYGQWLYPASPARQVGKVANQFRLASVIQHKINDPGMQFGIIWKDRHGPNTQKLRRLIIVQFFHIIESSFSQLSECLFPAAPVGSHPRSVSTKF